MLFYDLGCVESTQDEARRILRDRQSLPSLQSNPSQSSFFTVSAIEQTKGRGTSGRSWIGQRGNCFFTVAFPVDWVKVPITLLPLKIGSIVRHTIEQRLSKTQPNTKSSLIPSVPRITVKWPNDVLVDDRKIAGILIETENHGPSMTSCLLIGIGINVAETPTVSTHGAQRGRPATSIKDCFLRYNNTNRYQDFHLDEPGNMKQSLSLWNDEESYFIKISKDFAKIISGQIYTWLLSQHQLVPGDETSRKQNINFILHEWENHADLGKPLILRDVEGNQEVIPVALELDGRLRVLVDGEIRLLSSDYLL